MRGGSEFEISRFPNFYKPVEVCFLAPSAAVQLTPVPLSYPPPEKEKKKKTPGLVPLSSVLSHDAPYNHVLQTHSHLPRPRRPLRQRPDHPGRS